MLNTEQYLTYLFQRRQSSASGRLQLRQGFLRPIYGPASGRAHASISLALSTVHYGFIEAAQELDHEATVGRNPPVPFTMILLSMLPPDVQILEKDHHSEPGDIMEKLKKLGKTTWMVFKRVLNLVKAASVPCPPLKIALEALCAMLDQLDIASDAQDCFFNVSSKLAALQHILYGYRGLAHVKERLIGLEGWVNSVKVYIDMQTEKSWAKRIILAKEDTKTVTQLLQSFETVIDFFMLDTNLSVEGHVRRLGMKMDDLVNCVRLKELNHVPEAGWSAQKEDKCLVGTRCKVLSDLIQWCNDPSQPRVFWLSGMAGTGKSAIARTLCDHLHRAHLLGGSFFCSRRGAAGQREVKRIVPTLARHLARLDSEYTENVVERLKLDSDIAFATIDRQLDELLAKPRSKAFHALKTPLILVVDGLDEGAEAEDTARLLEAILKKADNMPFRFFFTSRPESHIRDKFSQSLSSKRTILYLHNVEDNMVKADIQLYVQHRLLKIKEESQHNLPKEWPTKDQVAKLAERADKLFIYAFTACNYIKRDPEVRLKVVIRMAVIDDERPLVQRLDDMYTLILDEAKDPEKVGPGIVSDIQKCLTALVCAQETLSVNDLAALMETKPGRIRIVTDDLHSLILVPEIKNDGPVTTLHASLGDYLTDERRSKHHAITKNTANWILLRRCLRVLSQELCFNVSRATTSFLTNDQQRLTLPYTLAYTAANWARHMAEISPSEELLTTITDWVKSTLIPKFLFWLEVMSVCKKVDSIQGMLWALLSLIKEQAEPEIIKFLHDALLFVNGSGEAIQRSTPHIYLSALALCSQESRIRTRFEEEYGGVPSACWNDMQRSRPSLLCIGHCKYEEKPFAKLKNQKLRVRNHAYTDGQPQQPDFHIGGILSISFSPDFKRIVSGSSDKTVRVWDAQTGRLMMSPFEGHADEVGSVAFSPNGKYIVSGSDDATVRIWDAQTGLPTSKPLGGHTEPIYCVKFSPNSEYIVSGSADKTVRVWDTQTGALTVTMGIFEGHILDVNSVEFSPDGNYLVSGSDDRTVRIWNARTGRRMMAPLRGHTDWVHSVAFAPNGKLVVSGSSDETVRLWDAQTGQPVMKPLQGHSSIVISVAFSPNGKYIVSGSNDCTIRVWDTQTGRPTMRPLRGHTSAVTSVAFSPDGKYIISGSDDKTIRLWNASVQNDHDSVPNTTHAVPALYNSDVGLHNTGPAIPVKTKTKPSTAPQILFSPYRHHSLTLADGLLTLPLNGPSHHSQHIFTIYPQNSGWILGPQKELFLWVPHDIRSSLWLPRAAGRTSKHKVYLDLSGYSCGPCWTECHRPLASKRAVELLMDQVRLGFGLELEESPLGGRQAARKD